MPVPPDINAWLDVLAKILLRCFFLGYVLLGVWFAVFLLAPGLTHSLDGRFELTAHEVNLINYGGMALVKGLVLTFFLLPYFSIRWVLRKHS